MAMCRDAGTELVDDFRYGFIGREQFGHGGPRFPVSKVGFSLLSVGWKKDCSVSWPTTVSMVHSTSLVI